MFDDALLHDGQEQLPYSFTIWRVTGRCARSARGMRSGDFAAAGVRSRERKPNAHTSVTRPSYTPYWPTAVSSSVSCVLLGSSWVDAPYCTHHVSDFVFMYRSFFPLSLLTSFKIVFELYEAKTKSLPFFWWEYWYYLEKKGKILYYLLFKNVQYGLFLHLQSLIFHQWGTL